MCWLYLMIIGSAFWVLIDASLNGVKKGQMAGILAFAFFSSSTMAFDLGGVLKQVEKAKEQLSEPIQQQPNQQQKEQSSQEKRAVEPQRAAEPQKNVVPEKATEPPKQRVSRWLPYSQVV